MRDVNNSDAESTYREPTREVYSDLVGGCLHTGAAIITFSRCEPCMYGGGEGCHEPPTWHSWAGTEDLEHAGPERSAKIAAQVCACECARELEQCS